MSRIVIKGLAVPLISFDLSLFPNPKPRAHKNGRLEEECVTPIEVRSPGKIIELY